MTKQLMRPFSLNTVPTLFPNDLFEDFFGKFLGELDTYNPTNSTLSLRRFPKGDIYTDNDGNRVIELALAGYSKDQLSVTVEDDKLIVAATKCEGECECKEESKEECSCCCGTQSRTLARRAFKQIFSNIGKQYNLEGTDVSYRDGLLKIVVPKAEKQEIVKTLEIK